MVARGQDLMMAGREISRSISTLQDPILTDSTCPLRALEYHTHGVARPLSADHWHENLPVECRRISPLLKPEDRQRI